MNKFHRFVLFTCLLISCTSRNENNPVPSKEAEDSQTLTTEIFGDLKAYPRLRAADTLRFELMMDSIGHHDTVFFDVPAAGQIHAYLNAETEKANIRIAQIGLPDGRFDGPFGKELSYNAQEIGTYQIISGQNLMAENAWVGPYQLTVTFQMKK